MSYNIYNKSTQSLIEIAGNVGQKVLTYTKSEWETADHTTVPDGASIIITDDYDSNIICNTVEECNESSNIEDVAGASAVKELKSDLSNIVGDEWTSGKSYSVGDCTIYNNTVYECILAHTSSESILPTDTTYWSVTSLSKINGNLSSIGYKSILETVTFVGSKSTLNDSIENYDILIAGFYTSADSSLLYVSTEIWMVEPLKLNYGKLLYSVGGNLDTRIAIKFTDATTVEAVSGSVKTMALLTLYGVKL